MNFYAKISVAVAGLVVAALAAVFLLPSSDEKAIQKLLERGLDAAKEGDADGVIALLSADYRNGAETREEVERKIRRAVRDRMTPAKMERAAVQVSGEDADASVRISVGAFQLRREFGLRLKLRKENGVWRVTGAQEVGE